MYDLKSQVAEVFEPLLQPARYKGAYGGRGSGKSWFFAGEAVEAMLEGLQVLCIREIQISLEDSVKQLIADRIEALGVAEYFVIIDKEIRCPSSGGRAIFKGMQNHTAASVKSMEGFDRAWWEEAQTASQKSLDLLIPTIRRAGSELWFSWNPENADDPIEFLRQDPPEGAIVVHANYDDNPWFPDELEQDKNTQKRRDPDKYLHIWEGEYKGASESRVYKNWREGTVDVPDNIVWFYGVDWGFSNDPNAGLRVCFPDEETAYIDAEVYEIKTPMERIPALLQGLPEAKNWPMRGDSARPETIDYVRRHGFPRLYKAKKGKGSVEDGITFLQGVDLVVHPDCVNVLHELKHYAYKTDPRTDEVLPVVQDGNDHLMDALRYAVEGLHRKGKLIKSEVERQRPRGHDYDVDEDDGAEDSWRVA